VTKRDGSSPHEIPNEASDVGYSPADWSPINDLILYDAHHNISWIDAVSPGGTMLDLDLPLNDPNYVDYEGSSWAPDGTRIAVAVLPSSQHIICFSQPTCADPLVGLAVVDLSGNLKFIRQGMGPSGTAWSPDGAHGLISSRGSPPLAPNPWWSYSSTARPAS
jgi:hypothetical protein